MSQQRPYFSPHSKAKAKISGKWVTSGISDVAIASVHSEKTCLKKMIIIISMNKSQELVVFHGRQKLTSSMKQRPESDGRLQMWCSIQLSLHRELPEVRLVKS